MGYCSTQQCCITEEGKAVKKLSVWLCCSYGYIDEHRQILVPAAAVIREVQVLFLLTGRIGYVGSTSSFIMKVSEY